MIMIIYFVLLFITHAILPRGKTKKSFLYNYYKQNKKPTNEKGKYYIHLRGGARPSPLFYIYLKNKKKSALHK